MQVILLADIDKLGYKHQVVDVKPGYGRNYLIPQGLALVANKSNMGRLAELERQADRKEAAKYYRKAADFARSNPGFAQNSIDWFLSEAERME